MVMKKDDAEIKDEKIVESLHAARLIGKKLTRAIASLNRAKRYIERARVRMDAVFGEEGFRRTSWRPFPPPPSVSGQLGLPLPETEEKKEEKLPLIKKLIVGENRNPDRIVRPDTYESDSINRRIDLLKAQLETCIGDISKTWSEESLLEEQKQRRILLKRSKKQGKLFKKLYPKGEPF